MRRVLAGLALSLAVWACAPGEAGTGTAEQDVGTKPERAWTPAPVKAGNLRIATFNIRNFPKDTMGAAGNGGAPAADGGPADEEPPAEIAPRRDPETDLAMLIELLDKLDFDVLGVEEINDSSALDAVLERLGEKNGRRYASVYTTEWPHPQRVGIVVRADRLRIESPEEHPEIATRPTMRAGLSARIVSQKSGGADFGMLVLHLASGDSAGRAKLRAEQAAQAASVVAARQRELGDEDFIVVGDLNTARADEMPSFDEAIAQASGLSRQRNASGCSTYYVKGKGNPLLEPSMIDHVYTSSLAERDDAVALTSGAHCAERACAPFESSGEESGTSYWGVSDHCPVYFEIADEDRD